MGNKTMIAILQPNLNDEALKSMIEEAIEANVDEVFVLPSFVRRTQQLLSQTRIRLGSFVDFPLAAGTDAKVAYETGELFQMGVSVLNIPLSLQQLKEKQYTEIGNKIKMLQNIAFGRGSLRFSIDTSRLKELEKINLGRKVKELGIRELSLRSETFEEAEHNVTMFRLDAGEDLLIESCIHETLDERIHELYLSGANQVGVFFLE